MSISLMVPFGLPRHFHLLLCNCLVLSLFVFCGKSNKVTKLFGTNDNGKMGYEGAYATFLTSH